MALKRLTQIPKTNKNVNQLPLRQERNLFAKVIESQNIVEQLQLWDEEIRWKRTLVSAVMSLLQIHIIFTGEVYRLLGECAETFQHKANKQT